MMLGVKEFRERFSELAEGTEMVLVTKNGRVVGSFIPERAKPAADVDLDAWVREREASRDEWKASTQDWRERLAAYGLDENGEPIA